MHTFTFPVGYHSLHPIKIIDFQLNRWYSLGYLSLADVSEAAKHIAGLPDWKDEFIRLGDKALAEGRDIAGAFCYRAAEFHTHPGDPDKLRLYERFIDLFYNRAFPDEPVERHDVPYIDGKTLPALRVAAQAAAPRSTVVIFGGFDSFIEEFYAIATGFARAGYDVVMFEGPGQGGALKHQHLPMRHNWERPTAAVLDYFDLNDVTLLGISMGGWLCFRAAAFEPRVTRVIASSIAFDYMQIPPKPVADFSRWLIKREGLFNVLTDWKMRAMPQEKWGIDNLQYMMMADSILEATHELLKFNEANQRPDLVTQDVLILTGAEDHFIPVKMHDIQVRALRNARSMTEFIFGPETQAHNHCQVGNFGLALDTMLNWLNDLQPAPAPAAHQPELAAAD